MDEVIEFLDRQTRPTEFVCEDCMEGDHDHCFHEGGWPFQDEPDVRCGCHLTGHMLDNRASTERAECRFCDERHGVEACPDE